MLAGIARVLAAAAGSIAVFAFWIILFPSLIMLMVLYVFKFVPLSGQWRKRFREWRKSN
jgi:hypothetical protein